MSGIAKATSLSGTPVEFRSASNLAGFEWRKADIGTRRWRDPRLDSHSDAWLVWELTESELRAIADVRADADRRDTGRGG